MTRPFLLAAALSFAVTLAGSAGAQSIDSKGKCHDAKGHFAKMQVCKAPAAPAGKCRDIKTKKFAKCGAPNTEAVAAKK